MSASGNGISPKISLTAVVDFFLLSIKYFLWLLLINEISARNFSSSHKSNYEPLRVPSLVSNMKLSNWTCDMTGPLN